VVDAVEESVGAFMMVIPGVISGVISGAVKTCSRSM
jgi:hypothetical protein